MKAWTTLRKWAQEHPEQWGTDKLIDQLTGGTKYCATGYLLKTTGYTDGALERVSLITNDFHRGTDERCVARALCDLEFIYGITKAHIYRIIDLNDWQGLDAVIGYLRKERL